ncbi:MAG: RNA polymerase sigma factor [marine bacterium B5-7]|nr:MAG: RNA polymerase sigma factor [marine bacterium B5-7]
MDDADENDEALMLRYQAGDAVAFEVLYQRHRGPVYRFFLRQIGDVGISEELYQETWMRVIGARLRYRKRARFTTWIYRIANNLLIDHWRRVGARPGVDSLDFDSGNTPAAAQVDLNRQPEGLADDRARVAELLKRIRQLPRNQRVAFMLHYESGMSVEQIADATGVKRETAKSRLRYAMATLREEIA